MKPPIIWVVEVLDGKRWRPVEGNRYRGTSLQMLNIWRDRETDSKFRVTKYASTQTKSYDLR